MLEEKSKVKAPPKCSQPIGDNAGKAEIAESRRGRLRVRFNVKAIR
ncbi:uncharacterized protein PITG_08041 [Phytophthora infestans T30-4]|uniref:Uncharacterized protein n=1 Tax=Phytophthora infestans (strain T30-4) TaxID=403677 RepID=D0N9C1_PHYIT|nr:uncharacterized protein PITG_08041 [Phytophthora infestans T30-4]EEY54409.1 hypothetical protein PITG_08041 [Phytophthora infestans T30-4]|eukprot:XP_002904231.1 hypothetical protein PITG_08041 [Phytophthora infestans T30-4]